MVEINTDFIEMMTHILHSLFFAGWIGNGDPVWTDGLVNGSDWKWSTGQEIPYDLTGFASFLLLAESCVEIDRSYNLLYVVGCEEKREYICEKSL